MRYVALLIVVFHNSTISLFTFVKKHSKINMKETNHMEQIKIGKFIADCRKQKGLTQAELAEKLNITDRAISKWETGRGMPDSSIMLDLCEIFNISVNELLSGEKIETNNYNFKAEENLFEIAKKEEQQNEKLLFCENVIYIMATVTFIILIFVLSFVVENLAVKIILFILASIILFAGVSFALKIETETGYYECGKCHNKYIPTYLQVYFAIHFKKNRYMKCPKCGEKSWNKKILIK